jgi:hypothetical protein
MAVMAEANAFANAPRDAGWRELADGIARD